MQSQPLSSFYKPYKPIRRPISSQLLRIGVLLLGLDALSWVVFIIGFLLEQAGAGNSVIALLFALVAMLIFLYGIPAIFVGGLLVLIGFTIRWLGASGSFVKRISGVFSIGVGVLAWVPYLLVPDARANTFLVWTTSLTALLVGISLPLIGVVLFIIGVLGAADETSSEEKL